MTQPRPWGRTSDIVRTYRALNDPNAPAWSIKFVGCIAAFTLLLAGAGALWWSARDAEGGANGIAASGGKATFVEYVGLPPEAALDPAQAEAAYDAWKARHPDAVVLSKEPVREDGRLVGYRVTYRA